MDLIAPDNAFADELQKFIQHLSEPFRPIALDCVCFGLRISECIDADMLGVLKSWKQAAQFSGQDDWFLHPR